MQNEVWKKLDEAEAEIHTLGGLIAHLGWDQETSMPELAVEDRSRQTAWAEAGLHAAWTSEETGRILEVVNTEGNPWREARRKVWERVRRRKLCLPVDLVKRKATLVVKAQAAWAKARKAKVLTPTLGHAKAKEL